MRHLLCNLFIVAGTLVGTVLHAAERPNVLFIFLDDFGWKDTSHMGSDFYETPNLDALARGGMTFTNAYSCAANCAPARACLLSGQYTPRHRIFNVGTTARGKDAHRRLLHVRGVTTLDPAIRTWAQQIQDAGYRTGTFGKWHLSDDPLPYGFDHNLGGTHSGGPPKGYYPPHGSAPGLGDAPKGEWITDTLSKGICSFIEESGDQPWLAYFTAFAVHTPIQAKKDLVDKYKAKQPGDLHDNVAMATMIQSVDDGVGLILEKLEALGQRENTVILFFSDNGGYGPATDMDPLFGYKGAYYEGGIRVPFFVNWPGNVEAGAVSEEPIIGVDLYPTLCAITGADLPDQPIDGENLVPLFTGEQADLGGRPLYWHFPAYLQSYGGKFNIEQRDPLFRSRPCGIIRVGPWKLHQYFEDGGLELYDLENDLREENNLASTHPEKAAELLRQMEQWRTEIKAPVPTEKNPKFDAAIEAEAIEAARQPARKLRKPRAGRD